MSGPKFYTQVPGPEGRYRWVVLEAREVPMGNGTTLEVIAPQDFQVLWPTVQMDPDGDGRIRRWQETEGPARWLTEAEWLELTRKEN